MRIKNISIKNNSVSYKDVESDYVYTTNIEQFVAELYARILNPIFSTGGGKWYYLQEFVIQKAEERIPLNTLGLYSSRKTLYQLEQLDKLKDLFLCLLDGANKIPKTKSYSVALFDEEGSFLGCTEFVREGAAKFCKHFLDYPDKCKLTFFKAFATKVRLGLRNTKILTTEEAAQFYKH